jgi:hypothetical protein
VTPVIPSISALIYIFIKILDLFYLKTNPI